ncbi:thioredoxin domain-containing protein 6 isoform 2-T2 [Cyanocitta cristata]
MPALPWQPWGPASCCTKPREGGSGSSGPAAAAAARRSQEVRAKVGQQLDPRLEAVCSALCLGRLLKGPCSCRRMAAKKKEGVLQINITSQELWEEMLCLKGLIVVDVFQAWCGPCKPVVNLFQKIRNEVGSNLLHFAVGGELVAVVRGADAPLLQKTILEQLAGERKGLERGREPVLVPDRAFSREQGSTAPLQEEQREGQTGGFQKKTQMLVLQTWLHHLLPWSKISYESPKAFASSPKRDIFSWLCWDGAASWPCAYQILGSGMLGIEAKPSCL